MNLEFSIKPRLKKNIITKLLPGVIFGSFLISTSDAQAAPWALGPGPLAYTTTQGDFGGGYTIFDSNFSSFIGDKKVKILTTSLLNSQNALKLSKDEKWVESTVKSRVDTELLSIRTLSFPTRLLATTCYLSFSVFPPTPPYPETY
jgi:hypothetical protein